jgi:hypothetical protein
LILEILHVDSVTVIGVKEAAVARVQIENHPVMRVGVRDPRPDVMGDDVDSSRGREVGRFKETMQVACGSVEIVTSSRFVAFTETSRVEYDDAAACADQQRQNLPPAIQLSGHPGISNTGSPVPAVT